MIESIDRDEQERLRAFNKRTGSIICHHEMIQWIESRGQFGLTLTNQPAEFQYRVLMRLGLGAGMDVGGLIQDVERRAVVDHPPVSGHTLEEEDRWVRQ